MTSASVQPILALLADPVGGNPTQYMVEKAFAHHGLDWRFVSFEVGPPALADAIGGLRALGFAGAVCGEPHPVAVLPYLDQLDEVAELIGAVNLLVRVDEGIRGENTQGAAFLEVLRPRLDPAGKRGFLLGAGHAARAAAVELARAGIAELAVSAPAENHARDLADLLRNRCALAVEAVPWEGDLPIPDGLDLLVHATETGIHDETTALPLNLDRLTAETLVADLTADPPHTWLLRAAEERGCATLDGLDIYIAQAAMNFRRWTGVDPDRQVLREAVEEFLEL